MSEPVTTVVELGSSILLWLGGGSVVTIGISAFVSKLMADRALEKQKGKLAEELERLKGELTKEVETHKLTLRRAELLFEKEIAAANAFMVLKESLLDVVTSGDSEENAYVSVVTSFMSSKNRLREFKFRYWVVLSDDIRLMLDDIISTVTKHSDDMSIKSQNCEPSEVVASINAANDYSTLKIKFNKIEDALFRMVKVVL